MTPFRTPRAFGFAGALALALAFVAAPVASQAPNEVPKGDGEQVARPPAADSAIAQLKSPYCPTMLEVCSSGAGAALRDSIVDLAMEGWSTDQLVEWMIARHGEKYRALPKQEGKALVAWIVPPLGVALGVLILTFALKGMIRSEHDAPVVAAGTLTDEDESMLRDAMRELDEEEEATFF